MKASAALLLVMKRFDMSVAKHNLLSLVIVKEGPCGKPLALCQTQCQLSFTEWSFWEFKYVVWTSL